MVLWEYTELFFITALTFTILAFHSSINRVGKVFFLLGGGMMWGIIGWTLQSIDFKWMGSVNMYEYTYMPINWEANLPSIFGWLGVILMLLGSILAFLHPLSKLWLWITGREMDDMWGET